MRAIVFLTAWLACGASMAAATCEQLGNIAYTAEQLRNQGYSLAAVLAEADKLETSDNWSKQDVGRARQAVEQAFTLTRTPLEILQQCREAQPR